MSKRVLLMGSTQTKHIAELLRSNHIQCVDFNEPGITKYKDPFRKIIKTLILMKSDIVYCVGGSLKRNRVMMLAGLLKKKTVMHWIGTDVLIAKNMAKKKLKSQKIDVVLAGSKQLVKELGEIGIQACQVPIVPFKSKFELSDMPSRHSVLVYLPEGREEFYGASIVFELARREQNVDFHIVANNGMRGVGLGNIKFHGFLDGKEMEELYREITILFRYPKHDGLSMMVIEALGMGKNVLYKYEHPYVVTPKSEAIDDIYKVFKNMLDSPIRINKEGHDFVKEFYSQENVMELYSKRHVFD